MSGTGCLTRPGTRPSSECGRAWKDRTGDLVRVETDNSKLNQFMVAAPYILMSQRSSCGAFSPMHGYTYAWVRDSNGPLRYLAAAGMAETVGQHLDYHFRACAKMGKVYNNVPLDMDVKGTSPTAADWGKMPVERAEVPSFVILQHYWYWRATGDATLIKFHWPMLRRCLLAQEVAGDGTLPFHGDETHRFPGYELFNAGEKNLGLGVPRCAVGELGIRVRGRGAGVGRDGEGLRARR